FFQAEDGIRDYKVTGVQTCALPISDSISARMSRLLRGVRSSWLMLARNSDLYLEVMDSCSARSSRASLASSISRFLVSTSDFWRSEERRVGKEGKSRWSSCERRR